MVIALIGDVVGSKEIPRRPAWQRRLARALAELSAEHEGLSSPYTLTLGDEFQAVYHDGRRVIADALRLQSELHPVRVRFAVGVGRLSTPLNPHQALGMDGPAFHSARRAMESIKGSGRMWELAGAGFSSLDLLNHVLAYLGHHMADWEANRLVILQLRLAGVPVADMATRLRISKAAVHKNIRAAALDEVAALCQDITEALQAALSKR